VSPVWSQMNRNRRQRRDQLGGGLFEFRLRDSELLLRVFCHAYGDRIVLLLHGYDKGVDPSDKRQAREIAEARHGLARWKKHHRD